MKLTYSQLDIMSLTFNCTKNLKRKTGIRVNVISGKSKPLEKRILEEDRECIGDIFFLADAGRLVSAEQKRYFSKNKLTDFRNSIPKHFRNEYWFD